MATSPQKPSEASNATSAGGGHAKRLGSHGRDPTKPIPGDAPRGSYVPGEDTPFSQSAAKEAPESKSMEEVTERGIREPGDSDFPRPGQKGYPPRSKSPPRDPARIIAQYRHRASPYGLPSPLAAASPKAGAPERRSALT